MKSMQNPKQKVAVVVQGYYEKECNQCVCIYLLDKKKQIIIPLDTDEENEIIPLIGDLLGRYRADNYKVSFSDETDFDVTKYFPQRIEKNKVFQKLGKHTICLN
jgi:hypothetical protein